MTKVLSIALSNLLFVCCCSAADLTALPDHLRVDPYGKTVEADRPGIPPAHAVALETARGGYVSCQLLVSVPRPTDYQIEIKPVASAGGIQPELYREWFHYLPSTKSYYPDALIPASNAYHSHMPEPDNKIADQTVQAFWLDLWIPGATAPGTYSFAAALRSDGTTVTVPISVKVLAAAIPEQDAVAIDHNTYGTSWLPEQYPELAKRIPDFFHSDQFFSLIHSYHRLFYQHRGVFHQLGYGHAGKVGPEFAPQLAGTGKSKHIVDWNLFDRHYGPLLDGSAFASTHRGAHPIPFVYLPINPEWPASLLWWGEPGYEREFVNVVSAMEQHFREKNWTQTHFELFFNHKKRYKGFEWDGDEARFPADYAYFREYARLMKAAVPRQTPVQFVFRADVSWTMERQFKEFAGIVNFWVCGGGMFSWYRDAAQDLKRRGDIVWIYGGTPPVNKPSALVTLDVLRPWIFGVDGFVHWLATSPGSDPWFQFEGGGETLVYPGDRFGISAPIPSIRLKIQRNAVQDVTLLNSFRNIQPVEKLRSDAAKRFNGTSVDEWWTPRPALANTNPADWTNADIADAESKNPRFEQGIDASAWQRVRGFVLELARGVR